MKLIVGLGNPGKEYENTRHNAGFIVLDNYADLSWKNGKYALEATSVIGTEKVLFIKPLTFMNLSGKAVSSYVNFYKIDPKDILVIHDDLDTDMLSFKLKFNSSDGGHNGIKNIITLLGTKEFSQLKCGIKKNKDINTVDYVLGKFSQEELDYLKLDIFKEVIDSFIINGIDKTMNLYNRRG